MELERGIIFPELPFDVLIQLQLLANTFEFPMHTQAILVIMSDDVAEIENAAGEPLSQLRLDLETFHELLIRNPLDLFGNFPAPVWPLDFSVYLLDAADHIFQSWPLANQVGRNKLQGDLLTVRLVFAYLGLGPTVNLDELLQFTNSLG